MKMFVMSLLFLGFANGFSTFAHAADIQYCGKEAVQQSKNLGEVPLEFIRFEKDAEATKYGFLENEETYKFIGKRSSLCVTYYVDAKTKDCRPKGLEGGCTL